MCAFKFFQTEPDGKYVSLDPYSPLPLSSITIIFYSPSVVTKFNQIIGLYLFLIYQLIDCLSTSYLTHSHFLHLQFFPSFLKYAIFSSSVG